MTNFPFPAEIPTDPEELADLMRRFAEWENHPEEARQLFVRGCWKTIGSFSTDQLAYLSKYAPVVQRLLAARVSPEDIVTTLRYGAYSGIFGALMLLDEGCDSDSAEQPTGWMLVETVLDDEGEPQATGRHLGGLHESILSADPSGNEGSDLFS